MRWQKKIATSLFSPMMEANNIKLDNYFLSRLISMLFRSLLEAHSETGDAQLAEL